MHSVLFDKLDRLNERCTDLEQVIETEMIYNVLQKVTIGCTKGDKFTKDIKNIHAMFDETVKTLTNETLKGKSPELNGMDNDVMHVYDKAFCEYICKDFNAFKNQMKQIDNRFASDISPSFEDNTTFTRASSSSKCSTRSFNTLKSKKKSLNSSSG